jgi:ATP-dependent DNA ligase
VLFPAGAGKDGPELVDSDGVRRRYGIEPGQVPEFIALPGDPSDGLPGARGVGEKTARDLLRTHGSLEGAIAGALKSRVGAALRQEADQLRAFREIARLRRVDLPRPADRPTDFAAGAAAARARGMNRLGERLEASNSMPQADRRRGAPDRPTYRAKRDVAATPEPAGGGQGMREGEPDRAMPEGIVPMLASAGALPEPGEGWAYEFKWDGVRAIAYCQPGALRLESRNLNDITGHHPELAGLNGALGSHSVVLDGEVVCFDADGKPSFAALQHRMHIASEAVARQLAQTSPVTYVIFDALWLDGHSLTGQPYAQRREHLAALGLRGEAGSRPRRGPGRRAAGRQRREAAGGDHRQTPGQSLRAAVPARG